MHSRVDGSIIWNIQWISYHFDPMRSCRERWNYSGAPGLSSNY
jgi:hypothetical protein